MKYIKECTEILNSVLIRIGIAEENREEVLLIIKEQMGITPETLSNDIEIGEKNGATFEVQMKAVNNLLNSAIQDIE